MDGVGLFRVCHSRQPQPFLINPPPRSLFDNFVCFYSYFHKQVYCIFFICCCFFSPFLFSCPFNPSLNVGRAPRFRKDPANWIYIHSHLSHPCTDERDTRHEIEYITSQKKKEEEEKFDRFFISLLSSCVFWNVKEQKSEEDGHVPFRSFCSIIVVLMYHVHFPKTERGAQTYPAREVMGVCTTQPGRIRARRAA